MNFYSRLEGILLQTLYIIIAIAAWYMLPPRIPKRLLTSHRFYPAVGEVA